MIAEIGYSIIIRTIKWIKTKAGQNLEQIDLKAAIQIILNNPFEIFSWTL